MATVAAAAFSAAVGAVSTNIQAGKTRRTTQKIAKLGRRQAESQRIAAGGIQKREADRAKRAKKLVASKSRDIRNQNLARRGITPFGGEISEAVLDESSTVA